PQPNLSPISAQTQSRRASLANGLQAPLALLQFQQELLARQAAAKTRQAAIGADDAVARNDHSDGVLAIGETDSTHGVGVADIDRLLAIAARRAIRNFL